LVVDDETALVELVQSYLESEQYEVLTAADGRAALELARTAQPDLVVLDVMLPVLDGIEVCRQLRQFSDAYVIMLTARAEEIDKILGLTVGADDYLTSLSAPVSWSHASRRYCGVPARRRPHSNLDQNLLMIPLHRSDGTT
jgi:DNA-binding response OmpR family regulator